MNKSYTFKKLIESYNIEIPIIQRDYVQGNNEEIKNNFLQAIYDSLKNNNHLHLDFVYGVIKNNCFIPLDGQQRLTTLFLLYYYLSLKDNKFEEFQQMILKDDKLKFSYEIRNSSREFIEKLVNDKININSEKNISKLIKDKNWFFRKWMQDPTIYSMLKMLDSIQNIFKDENLFDKLDFITFSFLNPEELKIKNEIELYIKMNSRGKLLNEFENFKVHLDIYLDDSEKLKIDKDWFYIFWNLKKEELKKENNEKKAEEIIEKEIFGTYLNFFKNITSFYNNDNNDNNDNNVSLKIRDIFGFGWNKVKENLVKVLEGLISYKDDKIYVLRLYKDFKINVFRDFLKDNPSLEEKIRFYALMLYFIKIGEIGSNSNLFLKWMRISLNLVNNASPYAIEKDFFKLKEFLDKLSNILLNESINFYNELKSITEPDLPKYIKKQFEEEKIKADLICLNNDWEEAIKIAEKHWYLDGQIGFLIDFVNKDLEKFIEYRDKFFTIFNESIKKDEEKQMIIHRALLTIDIDDDYLPSHTDSRFTFCSFGTSLREKIENWREVFNDTTKIKIFKELLDKINEFDDLNEIINKFKFNCDDWKSYFINPNKNWTPISYARNYQIEWNSEYEIFLNRGYWDGKSPIGSWGWSKKAELYSYYFYKILKDKINENKLNLIPFKEINYCDSTEEVYCAINKWEYKNFNFVINIEFKNQKFNMEFFDSNKNKNEIDNKLKDLLKNNNFELEERNENDKDNKYINKDFTLCEIDKLIDFLKNLLKQLNDEFQKEDK